MKIEVLGPGCANCKRLEANVKKALEELKLQVEVIDVTDMKKIVSYGIIRTPGLVIDGEVKIAGRVPSVDEIKKLF